MLYVKKNTNMNFSLVDYHQAYQTKMKLLFCSYFLNVYDAVSANVMIWVLQMGESESDQMVSEKVKWA